MTFRERCARAAMREIIRAGSAEARVTNSDGQQVIQWSIPGEGDVARDAFAVADAMEAERAKRVPTAAPDTITDKDGTRLTFTPTGDGKVRVHATEAEAPAVRDERLGEEHIGAGASPSRGRRRDAELAAARREGRDAGLREAGDYVWQRRKRVPISCQAERMLLEDVRGEIVALAGDAPAPAPDVASLQAENAKLRAVAEAAAALVDGMGGADRLDLRADVKRALTGWRTK